MVSKRNKDKHVQTASVDWVKQLADEINPPFPPEGEGWYTVGQISEMIGRPITSTANALKRKKAEKKKFLHITVDGRRIALVHYRIK